jgi:very-short-patch-repair endonuclease
MQKIKKILPYNPKLKEYARQLRNNSTKSEILLWLQLKSKRMRGYDFDRQKPIADYIVDFFCYNLMLAVEIDGCSHQNAETYKHDLQKEKSLNEFGVHVLRIEDKEIFHDMQNVLRTINIYIDDYESEQRNTHP